MKKRFCRSLCLLMTLFMLLAISMPVAVAGYNLSSNKAAIKENVRFLASRVLQFMELEKELYGLENVDFSSLCLSERIPTYVLCNEGLRKETETMYYPILSGKDWVATAIATYDSAGKLNVQISTQYAKAYNKSEADEKNISLLFDDDSTFILAGDKVIEAAVTSVKSRARTDIAEFNNRARMSQMETLCLDNASSEIIRDGIDTEDTGTFNQCYLSVPCVQQASGSKECWASCVAAILGYYEYSTTIEEVYGKIGWDYDSERGGRIEDAALAMEAYGEEFSDLHWYSYGLTWWNLRTEIFLNRDPLFAECAYSEYTGHAVVVRGFYVYQNISQLGIIAYMDPVVGEYLASSVATDGDYYYVPSGTTNQFPMTRFWAVNYVEES